MNDKVGFDELVQRLDGKVIKPNEAKAKCPAHDDKNPSLSHAQVLGGMQGAGHPSCDRHEHG